MRNPPISVIASWPTPNYDDPEDRGPTLIIVEVIIIFLALFTLLGRIYVRVHTLKKSSWDDWLMVGAAICCIGVTIDVILGSYSCSVLVKR